MFLLRFDMLLGSATATDFHALRLNVDKGDPVTTPVRTVVWSTGGVGSIAIDAIRRRPEMSESEVNVSL